MGTVPDEINRDDMKTPTLKTEHYTTGRGGAQHLPFRLQHARNDSVLTSNNQAKVTSFRTTTLKMRASHKTLRSLLPKSLLPALTTGAVAARAT